MILSCSFLSFPLCSLSLPPFTLFPRNSHPNFFYPSSFFKGESILADSGTEQLEFIVLSQRTGDPKYQKKVVVYLLLPFYIFSLFFTLVGVLLVCVYIRMKDL